MKPDKKTKLSNFSIKLTTIQSFGDDTAKTLSSSSPPEDGLLLNYADYSDYCRIDFNDGNKRFSCLRCSDQSFLRLDDFKHHFRSHTYLGCNQIQDSHCPQLQKEDLSENEKDSSEDIDSSSSQEDSSFASKEEVEEKRLNDLYNTKQVRFKHERSFRHKCYFCGLRFRSTRKLTIHVRFHTKEELYSCKVCQRSYPSKALFRKHSLIHKPKTIKQIEEKAIEPIQLIKCSECPKKFKDKWALELHKIRHHHDEDNLYRWDGEKPFKCPHCVASFGHTKPLKDHLMVHDKTDKPFKCIKCNQSFKQYTDMIRHLEKHIQKTRPAPKLNTKPNPTYFGNKIYKCPQPECKEIFYKSSHMKNHALKIHNKKKLFECKQCRKGFNLISFFEAHLQTHQDQTQKKTFSCKVCYKVFATYDAMNEHFKALHKPLEFECQECRKVFTSLKVLSNHSRIHKYKDWKPHECYFCEKQFLNLSELENHIRTHTKQRPFKCNQSGCGKSFGTNSNLLRHKRTTHSNAKPFKCKVCDRDFKCFNNLKTHSKTQHGIQLQMKKRRFKPIQKSFKCLECDKSYRYSRSLKRHEQTQHNRTIQEKLHQIDQKLIQDKPSKEESRQKPIQESPQKPLQEREVSIQNWLFGKSEVCPFKF